ncbi:Long-chain-alcohol oxidase FAO2 [Tolypocladium capitatum]|uniref:Long-chain-alcohol oxidase FAO2 n=1 Tax=Tolypocladium capitatum TaxID=45235 RepID=A0A2K3QK04_9HYPO|nr:Long-chain-alcohol oxidase FAO2 [Tolypocladium capitatum]
MMGLSLQRAPVATPLPDPPSGDFMSTAQWETFFALLDGVLPSITSAAASTDASKLALPKDAFEKALDRAARSLQEPPGEDVLKAYLEYRPTEDGAFRTDVVRTLSIAPQRRQLAKVLDLLRTHPGSLLLTGYWNPVSKQPAKAREAIVKSWANSRIVTLRMLAKAVVTAAQKGHAMTSPYFGSLSGYTDVPRNWKAGKGYDYDFIQLDAGDAVHVVTTDVVIVGSGCGGGVSAKNLAEAGHKVLVVDKGYYFPPSQLPMPQDAACNFLYDHGGVYMSDNSSANVVCGGSWGGGGTVNWGVCFRLQDFVREEWAATGLPLFTSSEFDDCMDRVWDFVGAGTGAIRHNHSNQAILDGASKLGWKARAVEQNTANKEHYCGQCHLGCFSAEKRGPAVAWLPAAAKAGAEFMEGFAVDKVTFAADGITATGVEGLWTARDANRQVHTPESARTQRRVRIKAKRVVVSAGSLWSPVILAKSGIKNRNLGRNLHLHPCGFLTAGYKEDVRPWEGGIITSYSGEFENLDGKGHGVKLEPTCMVPYVSLSTQTWHSGLDAKLLALKYHHLNCFISLTRDRDTGRVYPDPTTGEPRIDYSISDFDRDHTLEGVSALAKICYATGATEIRPHLPGLAPYVPDDGGERQKTLGPGKDPEFTDPAFGAWLRQLRKVDNKPPVAAFGSAHQMGSCRMSAKEDSGVVDASGKVWGTENLYVADASVFPSASGVNPMVTVMSVADWISRGVAKDLKA